MMKILLLLMQKALHPGKATIYGAAALFAGLLAWHFILTIVHYFNP